MSQRNNIPLRISPESSVVSQLTGATADNIQAIGDWKAQSFLSPQAGILSRVTFQVSMAGNPVGYLYAEIRSDSGGQPGTLLGTSNPMAGEPLSGTHILDFYFDNGPSLANATTYWIVLRPGPHSTLDAGNRYGVLKNTGNPYANGSFSYSANSGGTWTNEAGSDLYFQIAYTTSSVVRILTDPVQFSSMPTGRSSSTNFLGIGAEVTGKLGVSLGFLNVRAVGDGVQLRGNILSISGNRNIELLGAGSFFYGVTTDFTTLSLTGNATGFIGSISGSSAVYSNSANTGLFVGVISNGSVTMSSTGVFGAGVIAGTLTINQQSSSFFGEVSTSATATLNGQAGMARGYVTQVGSLMQPSGTGSFISGSCSSAGGMVASGQGAHVMGNANQSGANNVRFNATGTASFALGSMNLSGTSGSRTLAVSGEAAFFMGSVQDFNTYTHNGRGSFFLGAFGQNGANTAVMAISSVGSLVSGSMLSSSNTSITGEASSFIGRSNGSVTIASVGSRVRGYIGGTASIPAGSNGSFISGYVEVGATVTASSANGGNFFSGYANGGTTALSGWAAFFIGLKGGSSPSNVSSDGSGVIGGHYGTTTSSAVGSLVFGSTNSSGTMSASGGGAGPTVSGYANFGTITASNTAAWARGVTNTGLSAITASGIASVAWGTVESGNIISSETGSWSYGDDINTSAKYGTSFGVGHVNNTYLTYVIGRYSVTPTSNPTTWTATDPLFVVGIGTSAVARQNAFTILKNGTVQVVNNGAIQYRDASNANWVNVANLDGGNVIRLGDYAVSGINTQLSGYGLLELYCVAGQISFASETNFNSNSAFNFVIQNGVTAGRPAGITGAMYFDTTLNRPIWFDGTNWIEADGTIV